MTRDSKAQRVWTAPLDTWWVRLPRAIWHYSPLMGAALSDGVYLTAWPRVALGMPVAALGLGLLEGATRFGDAPVPAVQVVPFVALAVILGTLAGHAGLMLVLGYALGDFVIAGPPRMPGFSPNALPPDAFGSLTLATAIHSRGPQLLSYAVLFLLAVLPTVTTRFLFAGPQVRQRVGIGLRLLAMSTVGAAVGQAALIYGWTWAAPMLIRPTWTWTGGSPPILPGVYASQVALLPYIAGGVMVVRGCVEHWTRRTRAAAVIRRLGAPCSRAWEIDWGSYHVAGLQAVRLSEAPRRRLPPTVWAVVAAALITVLHAGFLMDLTEGLIVLAILSAVLLAQAAVLPKTASWRLWVHLVLKAPPVARFALVLVCTHVLTTWVLSLPERGAHNGAHAPGDFSAEVFSLVASLALATALFPELTRTPTAEPGPIVSASRSAGQVVRDEREARTPTREVA